MKLVISNPNMTLQPYNGRCKERITVSKYLRYFPETGFSGVGVGREWGRGMGCWLSQPAILPLCIVYKLTQTQYIFCFWDWTTLFVFNTLFVDIGLPLNDADRALAAVLPKPNLTLAELQLLLEEGEARANFSMKSNKNIQAPLK